MIRQDPRANFGDYVYTYNRLAELWQKARQDIVNAGFPIDLGDGDIVPGLTMYAVDDLDDSDPGGSIYFHLFGARCYVAFTHDLENGYLEYGVVGPKDSSGRKRIRCSALQFDVGASLGQVGTAGPWSMVNSGSPSAAHFVLLSKIAPDLVKRFYGAFNSE